MVGAARGGILNALLVTGLLAGCTTTRVVAVPGPGVGVDPSGAAVALDPTGVQLVVRASAWRGSPVDLPGYVTPFHLLVVNGTDQPVVYQYEDLRLFDEQRFQYTALPPVEVERILRAVSLVPLPVRVAAAVESPSRPILHRRISDPFFWGWWWPPPYPHAYPPRLDDVYLQALAVGALQPDARREGFVYFPRLRPGASQLTFEFHYRLGDAERVLTVTFTRGAAGPADPLRARGPLALPPV